MTATKNTYANHKKSEGSRFTILYDIAEIETNKRETIPHIDTQTMGTSTKVLSEISNKKHTEKNQLSSSATKYLVESHVTATLSKPFKENVSLRDMVRASGRILNRAASKKGFVTVVSDLRRLGHFDVLAVLELRISGDNAVKIFGRLGFSNKFIVEATGFSAGIWLLWNENKVKLQVVASSKHTVIAVVAEGNRYWVLIIVYTDMNAVIRRNLWGYLSAIRSCFKGPWVLMGDFNEITGSDENRGGRIGFSRTGSVDWINENKLVDLGFIGQKYTWMTKRGFSEIIKERLDRALCSIDWRIEFAEGFLSHLPRIFSYHYPIFLNLHSQHIPRSGLKPFRFEAMW
ncbi:hypothetical protein Ddye_021614 [Dipteronia dyeriana]|uniref:Endonuclease/exonuclease/phosphatase domain-containing protein n=1 Tax=Dipteronia dyeriana TaxID=168575 RepID=A0AAD9U1Z1_9ROSI|nr:hypothetical protein Ddye_021614 [Dipteronia dyeriana]